MPGAMVSALGSARQLHTIPAPTTITRVERTCRLHREANGQASEPLLLADYLPPSSEYPVLL